MPAIKRFPVDPAESAAAGLTERLGYVLADDVAVHVLGCNVKTGRNRQSIGDFPPVYKIGARRVCRVDEVDKWIRARRVTRAA